MVKIEKITFTQDKSKIKEVFKMICPHCNCNVIFRIKENKYTNLVTMICERCNSYLPYVGELIFTDAAYKLRFHLKLLETFD